jgi:hypothetical protein
MGGAQITLRRLAHGVNGRTIMSSSGSDPEDKVVVDPVEPVEMELSDRSGSRLAKGFADASGVVLARGTREQLPVAPTPVASTRARGAERAQAARDLERDPIEVLRAWPHSMTGREVRTAALHAASEAAGKPRVDDKIRLAHLALDLYREVELIQASSRRAASAQPEATVCTNRGCDVRIDALRGALIEACLLVQRVAMTTPTARSEIEDRIRELLALLEQ